MRKITLLFLAFLPVIISAQNPEQEPRKHNFLIESDFSYYYDRQDRIDVSEGYYSYPYSPNYDKINRSFNISLGAGVKIFPNLYAGARFGIKDNKEVINPFDTEEDVVQHISSTSGYAWINTDGYTETTITGKHTNYQLFIKYERNIHSFLWAEMELYGGIVNVKSSRELRTKSSYLLIDTLQGGVHIGGNVGQPYGTISTVEGVTEPVKNSQIKYFIAGLRPSIKLAFFQNCGITLVPGIIEYGIKTSDSRILQDSIDSHSFLFDFTPKNWMFGFYFRF